MDINFNLNLNSEILNSKKIIEKIKQNIKNTSIATLTANVIYFLVIKNIVKPNTGNKQKDIAIIDSTKMFTLLFVSQTINNILKGKIDYNKNWIKTTLIATSIIYVYHIYIFPKLKVSKKHSKIISDIGKVLVCNTVIYHFNDGDIFEKSYLISLGITILGIIINYKLIQPNIKKIMNKFNNQKEKKI